MTGDFTEKGLMMATLAAMVLANIIPAITAYIAYKIDTEWFFVWLLSYIITCLFPFPEALL